MTVDDWKALLPYVLTIAVWLLREVLNHVKMKDEKLKSFILEAAAMAEQKYGSGTGPTKKAEVMAQVVELFPKAKAERVDEHLDRAVGIITALKS